MWHGINDLPRSFVPPQLAFGSFQSDYSHYYGPVFNMVFNHFKHKDKTDPIIAIHLLVVDRFFQLNFIKTLFQDTLYSDFRHVIGSDKFEAIDIQEFPSLTSFRRNLRSFVQITANDQVKLILATQPFLYREGLDREESQSIKVPQQFCVNKENKYPNLKSMIKGMNLFNATTREIAKDYNLPLIDLDAAIPKSKIFYFDDCHYTEKGNQLVAETIYSFIVAKNLID